MYKRQLAEDLEPPVAKHVDRLGTRRLLNASRRMPPGKLREQDDPAVWIWSDLLRKQDDPAVWIWSDLHLGYPSSTHSSANPHSDHAREWIL